MSPPSSEPNEVDALIAQGNLADAARLAEQQGNADRAQALYEKIWDFKEAARIAKSQGDTIGLVRNLLDDKNFESARSEAQAAAPSDAVKEVV